VQGIRHADHIDRLVMFCRYDLHKKVPDGTKFVVRTSLWRSKFWLGCAMDAECILYA
jgi:hypothetical protein